jgi:hypothetical protein
MEVTLKRGGHIRLPKPMQELLRIGVGTKLFILPAGAHGFEARIHRPSKPGRGLVPVVVRLDHELRAWLRTESRRQGVSQAEVGRQVVHQYLTQAKHSTQPNERGQKAA